MGCERPPQLVAGETVIDDFVVVKESNGYIVKFKRHPELFLTPSVLSWIKEYDYYNGNYSVIPYHERSALWIEALETYEFYMRVFRDGKNTK